MTTLVFSTEHAVPDVDSIAHNHDVSTNGLLPSFLTLLAEESRCHSHYEARVPEIETEPEFEANLRQASKKKKQDDRKSFKL